MKLLFIDCFAGAAGDMLLSALVHVGADQQLIIDLPNKLGLENLKPQFSKDMDHGLSGLVFKMPIPESDQHRHLSHITKIINDSNLSDRVKEGAIKSFTLLAVAEAKVHDTTPEKIHFHEVGADDAIVDIVGFYVALESLDWPEIYSTPLVFGHGVIKSAHGMIPLPGPAVTEIVKAVPVRFVDFEGETVTPTGAALIVAVANFDPLPTMTIDAVGYGLGTRRYDDRPNMVRLVLGQTDKAGVSSENDQITVIETNIDDMNPQIYDYLFERLYEAGALEAFITPVIMKKNRPGQLLTVLAKKPVAPALSDIIFAETTTTGMRISQRERLLLPRQEVEVECQYGTVTTKIMEVDRIQKAIPEFEQCRRLARENNVPVSKVIEAVLRNYSGKD